MRSADGPVYEVALEVDQEIADEFDAWLEQHISDVLEIAGFLGAESFAVEGDTPGRTGRVVSYTLDNEQSLEDYLDGTADPGTAAEIRRDVVRSDSLADDLQPLPRQSTSYW